MILMYDIYTITGTVDEIIEFINKRGSNQILNPYNILGSLDQVEPKDLPIATACPHCGKSHFTYKYSLSDGVYRPTIIKDGKVQPHTTSGIIDIYECLECGKEFTLPATTITADTSTILGAVGIKTANEVN